MKKLVQFQTQTVLPAMMKIDARQLTEGDQVSTCLYPFVVRIGHFLYVCGIIYKDVNLKGKNTQPLMSR